MSRTVQNRKSEIRNSRRERRIRRIRRRKNQCSIRSESSSLADRETDRPHSGVSPRALSVFPGHLGRHAGAWSVYPPAASVDGAVFQYLHSAVGSATEGLSPRT